MQPRSATYTRIQGDEGTVYVRGEWLDRLSTIGALLFDCDGVLVDARRSYDRAIIETVTFFSEKIICSPFPKEIVSPKLLARLRESGGFNCDWDSVYVILLSLFSQAPLETQRRFLEAFSKQREPSTLLKTLKAPPDCSVLASFGEEALLRIAEVADDSGRVRVEREVFESCLSKEALSIFKKLLAYPGLAGESILATVFDEMYYGSGLLHKARGLTPRFYQGKGFIEDEKLVVSASALSRLRGVFGRENLGIVSGRSMVGTRFTLGGLWDHFNPEAMVFVEDEEVSQREALKNGVRIGKPEPYTLLKAAKAVASSNLILYLGDSAEDIIMSKKACLTQPRFAFAGIYKHTYYPERIINMFMEREAELIIPTVNELPKALGYRED